MNNLEEIIPPDQRGYADSSILVTTDWLAEHIGDPLVRIVDTDLPEDYDKGHIPGAVNPVDHYYKTSLEDRTHIQGPEQFAQTMGELGIGDDTLVVGYDRSGGLYSLRLMWSLHYYGHTNVKMLDGGFQKWRAEGRPTTTEPAAYPFATFTPDADPSIFADMERVLSAIDDEGTVLLDVRTDEEWNGTNKRGGKRGGRIPGAVHMEWVNFHTGGGIPVLKTADELRSILAEVGVTPDKNVITY